MAKRPPHPLAELTTNPDFHAFISAHMAEPENPVPHGVLADWLEERGHDVLAKVFRRHPVWRSKQDEAGRSLAQFRSEFQHTLSHHSDQLEGRTTGIDYHRMAPPPQNPTAPRFHAVQFTHHRWWNRSGPNFPHAISAFAPVTKAELRQLVKQYARPQRGHSAYNANMVRHQLRNRDTWEYPEIEQLAREDMPALPTRASLGMKTQPAVPKGNVWYGFRSGRPYHFADGSQTFHDPEGGRQEFLGHMARLNSPEATHMAVAASTGHQWHVSSGDYDRFMRYDPRHLAVLGGARRGDQVEFHIHPITGHEHLRVVGKGDHTGKFVSTELRPHEGNVYLDSVDAPGMGGTGWGTRYFFDALRAARKTGFNKIIVRHAAGNPQSKLNGFYTWPRLGFEGPITSTHDLPSHLAHHFSFHNLFDDPEGPAAWKAHGADQFDLEFDVRPGSPHVQRLVKYLRESRAQKKTAWRMPTIRTKLNLAREDWNESPDGRLAHREILPGVEFYAHGYGGDSGAYEVSFQRRAGKNRVGLDSWTTKATNDQGHKAVHIMRHVLAATKDFMADYQPKSFHFSAAKQEASRVKLYDRAAKIIADQHGYDHEREDVGDIINYYFTKRAGE